MREVYCVVVLIAKAVSEVRQKMLRYWSLTSILLNPTQLLLNTTPTDLTDIARMILLQKL